MGIPVLGKKLRLVFDQLTVRTTPTLGSPASGVRYHFTTDPSSTRKTTMSSQTPTNTKRSSGEKMAALARDVSPRHRASSFCGIFSTSGSAASTRARCDDPTQSRDQPNGKRLHPLTLSLRIYSLGYAPCGLTNRMIRKPFQSRMLS